MTTPGHFLRFGNPVFRLDGDIAGLAVSSDGAWIAIATDEIEGQIQILDANTGAVRAELVGTASSLAFVDSTTLWSAYAYLRRHRLGEREPTFSSGVHGSPIALSHPAELLAAARRPADAGDVDLLSLVDGSLVSSLAGPGQRVTSLAFSPDGGQLAVGYAESAAVFDLENGRSRRLPEPKGGVSRRVSFAADGRIFIRCDVAETIVIDRGPETSPETWKVDGAPDAFALSSRLFAFAAGWGGIRWLNAANGDRIGSVEGRALWGPMAFLSETRLAVASSNHLRILDLESGVFENASPGHDGAISAVAITRDGTILATAASFDQVIHLWRTSDGTHLGALIGHDNYCSSLSFSPDGHTLVSAGRDGALRLYDVASGKVRHVLENAHEGSDTFAAFSPRGDLATASEKGDIALRDANDGRLLAVIAQARPGKFMERARIAFDATGDWLGCLGPREELVVIRAAGDGAGTVAFTAPADTSAFAFALDAPTVAYAREGEVVLASIPSGNVIERREAPNVSGLAFLPGQRLLILTHGEVPELFDLRSGKARKVPVPNVATTMLAGVSEDDVFVGLRNGTCVLANVGATSAAALARLRTLVRQLGTTQQFVGYRDAPTAASAPDDPLATIVTRGLVTMVVRVEAEDDERWKLSIALPKEVEPGREPAPTPPPPPPKPWYTRAIESVFGGEAGGTSAPTPASSPTDRTFVMRGRFAEPPSSETIEEWISAFARTHGP